MADHDEKIVETSTPAASHDEKISTTAHDEKVAAAHDATPAEHTRRSSVALNIVTNPLQVRFFFAAAALLSFSLSMALAAHMACLDTHR